MADLMFGFDTTQKKSLERLGLNANDVPDMTYAELITYVQNLNAWAIALATKLNADLGVQDTDYDTNPQA